MSYLADLQSLELQLTVVCLAAATAAQALVALWAAVSKQHWFIRALVVWASVLALLPIRAFEPALVFSVSSPLTIAVIFISRQIALGRKPSVGEPATYPLPRMLRYRLSDLFLLTLLLGLSLATLGHLFQRAPLIPWHQVL